MNRLKVFTDYILRLKEQVLKQTVDRNSFAGGQHQKESEGGIPLGRKLCYALGGVPYQMTTVAIGVSLQIFLLDIVQMKAFYVSMILFVSRAWDALTDPLVGYLVSRSSWTPIGKLSPWLVLSTPFGILSYLLLWFVPQGPTSTAHIMLWFLTVTCLFETIMSCYNVPYLSLNMFLGGNKRDRDSATAYRMSVEMAAMLLASIIQGKVVAVYNTEKQENCQHLDQAQETAQSTSSPPSLHGTQRAFLTSALVIGALFFLCSLIIFLGVKEHRAPNSSTEKRQLPFLKSFKMLVCYVPYHRLVLGFMISTLAYQLSLGNFALFCSHAAGLGAHFQYLLLVLLGSASIAVPIWQNVLLRIGKKRTIFIGLSVSKKLKTSKWILILSFTCYRAFLCLLKLFIPAVIVVACVPSNLTVFMVMCVVMGFSVATIFLLPWSMLPDVVDDFAVRNPACKDLEPLFFSCYAFCSKLAGGLSAGISTMTLQFVGYRAGACNHSDEVVTALLVLFSPVPIALILIGMFIFLFYPVNERQSLQLQEQIATVYSKGTSSSLHQGDCKSQISNAASVTATTHAPSDESKCALGKYSRPKCVVQPNVHLQHHKQRHGPQQHSAEDANEQRNASKTKPCSFSDRPKVKSEVTWV